MTNDAEEANGGKSSDSGCLGFVVGLLLIAALLFGVTIDGKHYGLRDCGCDTGLVIDAGGRVRRRVRHAESVFCQPAR